MYMEIAIGAIAIAITLMIGYVIVSQVQNSLPTASTVQVLNECRGLTGAGTSGCTFTACGSANISDNTSQIITCSNVGYTSGTNSTKVTVYAGLGLIAVGIIVLAAFGIINVFKN